MLRRRIKDQIGTKVKLNRDELHVWSARLDMGSQRSGMPERTLSADELARAGRFYFERDRHAFIGRRAILRDVLSAYLNMDPSELRFNLDEFGKPRLKGHREGGDLSFNLSRSRGLVLVAVALERDVGVDVEFIDSAVSSEEVAQRFFSANEIAALNAIPESLRLEAFFQCWSRKEAYIKARGMGLSIPLDSFDVSLRPGETIALLGSENSPGLPSCKIENLEVDPQYAAAVAATGQNWKVVLRTWQSSVRAPG